MGLELPAAPPPLAAYVPVVAVDLGGGRRMLLISGQVPFSDGAPVHQGRVPDEIGMDEARAAARLTALNILAQVEAAAGLDRVEQVASVTGYVYSDPAFGSHPAVINAASELLFEVLGEPGRHSRAAVGVASLPMGVPVEISAVVVVRADA